MLGMVYSYLPFMILPLYAALEKFDSRLKEAAQDLGASRWHTFWRVTFPLSMPGVIAGSILVFIPSAGEFVIPNLLGGARTVLVGNLIQQQFLQARDWAFGSALADDARRSAGRGDHVLRPQGRDGQAGGGVGRGRCQGRTRLQGAWARSQTGRCSCSPAWSTCSSTPRSWSWCSSRSTRPGAPRSGRGFSTAVVRGALSGTSRYSTPSSSR